MATQLPKTSDSKVITNFFHFFQNTDAVAFLRENLIQSVTELVCNNYKQTYAISRADIYEKATVIVEKVISQIIGISQDHKEKLFDLLDRLSIQSDENDLWPDEFRLAFAVYQKTNRNQFYLKKLIPYFLGESLIDIGCGRGYLLKCIQEILGPKKMKIAGTDICDYRDVWRDFDFFTCDMAQGNVKFDTQYDTGILQFVLHHIPSREQGVQKLLNDAKKMGIKRILVLEDVLISEQDRTLDFPGIEKIPELLLMQPKLEKYLELSVTSQFAFTAIMDVLSNCLFNRNNSLLFPFAFGTLSYWTHLFQESDWKVVNVDVLGFMKTKCSQVCNALFVIEPN